MNENITDQISRESKAVGEKAELQFRVGEKLAVHSLVEKYHYSHRAVRNASFVGSLHDPKTGEAVAGCVFFSPAARWSFPVLELARLVRVDRIRVPLTRLISLSCKELTKRGFDLLVSFADSTVGHHGGVYQAASWKFDGKRKPSLDGLIVNGSFVPGRSLNQVYKTRSLAKLRGLHPEWSIEGHYDTGKFLYWRALSKRGVAGALGLGLRDAPYPKPNIECYE